MSTGDHPTQSSKVGAPHLPTISALVATTTTRRLRWGVDYLLSELRSILLCNRIQVGSSSMLASDVCDCTVSSIVSPCFHGLSISLENPQLVARAKCVSSRPHSHNAQRARSEEHCTSLMFSCARNHNIQSMHRFSSIPL